jgi:hypothetical protein
MAEIVPENRQGPLDGAIGDGIEQADVVNSARTNRRTFGRIETNPSTSGIGKTAGNCTKAPSLLPAEPGLRHHKGKGPQEGLTNCIS